MRFGSATGSGRTRPATTTLRVPAGSAVSQLCTFDDGGAGRSFASADEGRSGIADSGERTAMAPARPSISIRGQLGDVVMARALAAPSSPRMTKADCSPSAWLRRHAGAAGQRGALSRARGRRWKDMVPSREKLASYHILGLQAGAYPFRV
jgi:hypothetical protein